MKSHDEADSVHGGAIDAAERLIVAVQKLSLCRSIDEVVEIVRSAARNITLADGACFVLRENEKCYYVDEDSIAPLWKGRRFPMEACISGWAMRNRQPVIIPDITVDARIPQDVYRPTFVRSLAVVPICSLNPIGAIGIYWKDTFCPTPHAVRWLQSLADSTALAIEHVNAQLEIEEATFQSRLLRNENVELRRDIKQRESSENVRMCFMTNQFELDGQWLSIEAFLLKRFGVYVTHGLNPDALVRLENDMLVESSTT